MSRLFVLNNHKRGCFGGHAVLSLLALLLCSHVGAWAQSTAPSASAPFSIRATHLLGFPNTKNNCNGSLAIKDDALRFVQDAKSGAEVKITSVQGVFVGSESKQVGGLPMKLGKTAAPYGGGRVVSLFAHKKYDTLTVEYADGDGGIHGAIFQLPKGQGEMLKDELMARGVPWGVSPDSGEDQPTKQSTAEVTRDNK